jgi:hypothetical protein
MGDWIDTLERTLHLWPDERASPWYEIIAFLRTTEDILEREGAPTELLLARHNLKRKVEGGV